MTEIDRIEWLRHGFEVFNRMMAGDEGARAEWQRSLHPDCEWHTHIPNTPFSSLDDDGHRVGREAILARWDEVQEDYRQWRNEATNLEQIGRCVVVDVRNRTVSKSGVPYESPHPISIAYEIDDEGLAVRWDGFPTREEAVAYARRRAAAGRPG